MQRSDFTDQMWGSIQDISGGYLGFVPHPLPPKIDWSGELVGCLSDADRAVATLAGVGLTLPNPHLLIRPFIRREAVLSSRIEGTQASLSDLLFFEAAVSPSPKAPDVREVANYVTALEYGLERERDLPISVRLLRELHGHLMHRVRGDAGDPGEFRRIQNWIGPPGCSLADATYVPPPVPEMLSCLSDLEKYIHAPATLPPLIRLAAVHYQFEAIHPFIDGNGRVGRLLTTLLLCVWDLLPEPLLYLSAYLERHRTDYYRCLLEVSRKGDWEGWLTFFLRGVSEQARDAVERSKRLVALRDDLRTRMQKAGGSARVLSLIDRLFEYPMLNVKLAEEYLGVTTRSAAQCINKLVDAGILREITGHKRNRVFAAQDVLTIIDAP